MHLSEQAEEVLEDIWVAREAKKSDCIKLSDLRVIPENTILKELFDFEILQRCEKPEEVRITKTGLIEARDAVRRHRLAERLLTDVLLVRGSLIHETACQFEHHLHKGIDNNVCTLLGHPKFCPHGRPIPPGKCCEKESKTVSAVVSPLSSLKPDEGGHVAYLHTQDPKQAQMLISMGVLPGVNIKLLASFPSLLFQLGEGQFAVDSAIASEIYVRRDE